MSAFLRPPVLLLHRNSHRQNAAKANLEPEISAPLAEPLPRPAPHLQSTTIYHLTPVAHPYHAPTTHPSDNDTLLLALTLSDPIWLRTRYLRTSSFLRETLSQKRLYRGLHGTAAAAAFDAPTKPKPLPQGILQSGGRVVAFGPGLPWRVTGKHLVTLGQTALGDVLTDGALVGQRGTELGHVCRYANREWFLTRARNAVGGILRSFVVRTGGDAVERLHSIDRVTGRELAVCHAGVVVVAWGNAGVGGVGGLLKGLFGRGEGPGVSVEPVTQVLFYPKSGGVVRGVVDGVLTNISITEKDTGVSVIAKRALCENPTLTTIQDIRSASAFIHGGRDGDNDTGIKSSIIRFEISDMIDDIREISPPGICVMDIAKVYDTIHKPAIYIGYESTSGKVGLWNLQNDDCWLVDDGTLSGALYNPQHTHLTVIHHTTTPSMLFFTIQSLASGPIASLPLPQFVKHPSIDGTWTDLTFEYSKHDTIQKSAYELFAEKNWNDIDSGFSSLGLR